MSKNALFVFYFMVLFVANQTLASPLRDAIRQAEQAKEEAQRLSREAEANRVKARALYKETGVQIFDYAADQYNSARASFEKAAEYFNSARYLLENMEKYKSDHSQEVGNNFRWASEKYDEGVGLMNQGSERFNRAISEFNEQLSKKRRDFAVRNAGDAFELKTSASKAIQKLKLGNAPAEMIKCMNTVELRAESAYTQFYVAKGKSQDESRYQKEIDLGIRWYNEALGIYNQTLKERTCSQP